MADTTILFPNYNNEHVLPLTFRYLRQNIDCGQVRLVMVDDGSEDEGVRVAKLESAKCAFKSVEIIELPHQGIIPALNAGLNVCRTEFIVRIDGDATVETPGWLERMCKWLKLSDEIGAVAGHVIFDHGRVHSFGRSIVGEAGMFDMGCCPLEPCGERTFDSMVYRPQRKFPGGPPYEVDTMLGVCVGFRLADARKIGGFDPRFNPVWIEDDDFGLSLRRLGKRLIVDPMIQIIHRVGLRGSRVPGQEESRLRCRATTTRWLQYFIPWRVRHAAAVICGIDGAQRHRLEDLLPKETSTWRSEILKQHYKAWEVKWGFDPINPNLQAIYERYWDTGLCWRRNPQLHERSQHFLATTNIA